MIPSSQSLEVGEEEGSENTSTLLPSPAKTHHRPSVPTLFAAPLTPTAGRIFLGQMGSPAVDLGETWKVGPLDTLGVDNDEIGGSEMVNS